MLLRTDYSVVGKHFMDHSRLFELHIRITAYSHPSASMRYQCTVNKVPCRTMSIARKLKSRCPCFQQVGTGRHGLLHKTGRWGTRSCLPEPAINVTSSGENLKSG